MRGSSTQQVVVMMVIIIKFHLRGKAGPLSVGPRKRENSRNIIFKLESELVSRPNVKFQEEGLGSKSCPYLLLAIIAYKALQLQGPWWWSSGQRSCLLLRRSEFDSCWLLNKFSVQKDENKRKRGRGWPI